jgi:hypothetical protein
VLDDLHGEQTMTGRIVLRLFGDLFFQADDGSLPVLREG